ncbi:MAG TPA: hypothetical protein VNA13_01110, partial [Xanthomonadales bacterium]|nr:hypothetical protein [Xanthomonadales bacterium]
PPVNDADKESHFQLWNEAFPDNASELDRHGEQTIFNPVYTDANAREGKLLRRIAERKTDPTYKNAYTLVGEMTARAIGAIRSGELGAGYKLSFTKTLINTYKEERSRSRALAKAR